MEAYRILDAREREDAFIENAIRERDTHVENNDVPTPQAEPPATATPPAPFTTAQVDDSMVNDPNNANDAPMSYEDMLLENNFRDVVNQKQEMYEDINAIPDNHGDMVSAIIATVQMHVSEVWSPPRITALAPEHGLIPGSACDIEVDDECCKPWNFDLPEQRNKCVREILGQRPVFLIGSPMRTAFSILQGLNRAKMDPTKWDLL